jgi:Anaphase-promoting complex subunit 4 WD40 domain
MAVGKKSLTSPSSKYFLQLKWHPQNEGSLVFGTEHGSVSLIDTYSGKMISFKSYHKGTVYSLDWVTSSDAFTLALQGNGSSQGPWVLSCDGRSVYVHDSTKPAKPAVNIDDAFREQNSVWIQSVQVYISTSSCTLLVGIALTSIMIGKRNSTV